MTVRILHGDARERLKELPDESVHCVVTSPPYFGLRYYGTAQWDGGDPGCDHKAPPLGGGHGSSTLGPERDGLGPENAAWAESKREHQYRCECSKCGARRIDSQIGLEPTPEAYVAELVSVFREVRRVLRKDGTCWLNLGDSYTSGGRTSQINDNLSGRGPVPSNFRATQPVGLKPKDLIGIPWRVAFALQADGWWLRQDIIWSKPNPMPESVTDRCTKAHEYIFLLTKSARYYYDAEAIAEEALRPEGAGNISHKGLTAYEDGDERMRTKVGLVDIGPRDTRNKRSVWTVATQPFSLAHFATFPPTLIEPCILAGCPAKCCAKCGAPWVRETSRGVDARDVDGSDLDRFGDGSFGTHRKIGAAYQKWIDENPKRTLGFSPSCSCDAGTIAGTVLDPFFGAGTTGLVADRLQRNCIGIEINPEYAAMAGERIQSDAPLFAEAAE